MIFIDSNIPMYLIGASHPLKLQARRLLERCIADSERKVWQRFEHAASTSIAAAQPLALPRPGVGIERDLTPTRFHVAVPSVAIYHFTE